MLKAPTAEEKRLLLRELMQIEYERARRRLGPFVRAAWDVLEPETELLWNWHHDLTCEYLEAVRLGQIRRLLINIPPRTGTKTIMASICFPVWWWIEEAYRRFLFSSYGDKLATRNSVFRRNLILSDWYQRGYGSSFSLSGDVNRTSEFTNDKTGLMRSSGIKSVPIGEGGDGIIIDDPHDPRGAESEKDREAAALAYDLGWSRRLNNAKTGFIIVIMQRLHEDDLTGHILAKDLGYTQLKIPMEAVEREVWTFPLSGEIFVREEGEFMHPDRFAAPEADAAQKELGDYGYAGQMQQDPVARGGNMFRETMIEFGPVPEAADGVCPYDYMFLTADTAYKDKQQNDYQCFAVWGVTPERLYAHDVLWMKLKAKDVEAVVVPWILKHNRWGFVGAYIEPKGHGIYLNQKLPEKGVPIPDEETIRIFYADRRASKVERANMAIPFLSTRKVILNEKLEMKERLKLEVLGFPKAKHDDFTDTLIDAIKRAYSEAPSIFDAL